MGLSVTRRGSQAARVGIATLSVVALAAVTGASSNAATGEAESTVRVSAVCSDPALTSYSPENDSHGSAPLSEADNSDMVQDWVASEGISEAEARDDFWAEVVRANTCLGTLSRAIHGVTGDPATGIIEVRARGGEEAFASEEHSAALAAFRDSTEFEVRVIASTDGYAELEESTAGRADLMINTYGLPEGLAAIHADEQITHVNVEYGVLIHNMMVGGTLELDESTSCWFLEREDLRALVVWPNGTLPDAPGSGTLTTPDGVTFADGMRVGAAGTPSFGGTLMNVNQTTHYPNHELDRAASLCGGSQTHLLITG